MILYHASTTYHVLCCIVHKLAFHKDEKATFMIVEHMLPKDELKAFINKLDSFSWFDEIISVPEGSFRLRHGKTLNLQSSENDILEVIHNICSDVDDWYPSGFHQFEELYVASDQWSVGVYLLHHRISYHYFEDASGMLGDEERYLTIIRELNLSNYVICNYLKGVGRSEIVVEKLCDMKNQPMGFSDQKATDFSIYHIVSALPAELIENILLLYDAKRYQINSTKKVVVYMTQFLKTLALKNLEVQEHITTLLLDYFASDCKVIVKPHPKDRWIDYQKLLPEAIILDNSLPSELLPFVLEGDFHLVLTASSTSVGGMSHIAKNSISFGTDIEIHYDRLHDMYIAAKLINEVFHGQQIIKQNIKSSHLEHFLSLYSNDFSGIEPSNSSIYIDGGEYIIGETNNYEFIINQRKDILIFLNYNQKYEFLTYPGLIHKNFIVIKNKLHKNNEIWVYCENEEERRKILSMKEIKTLKYSGLELEINCEEATYIMILTGKMKALQYALKQKENEEQNQVFCKIKEVIKQYQEEEITKRILLEEEGIM
jgi:hypothetical protein